MFTNEEDQKKFDLWTKEEVYQAYLAEYKARKYQGDRANKAEREVARLKWELQQILKTLS